MVEPLQPEDPRRLGSWRLLGRLGAGGMGVVYLARGRRGQRVAVKVLHPRFAADPTFRARFRREAALAARATTPGTAHVIGVGDGKSPYLVTEFVEGPTLHDAVTARGPLRGEELQRFAAGLAEAMAGMHAAGVTHRDLTPGNVILSSTGPRVIDFGIARGDDDSTLTQIGTPIGTPMWMAPEQALGQRAGPAADTFAWGSLVAYAGTGRHPFGEGSVDAVLYRIIHEPPALEGLDPSLVPTVTQALAKDPAARPVPADVLAALRDPATRPRPAPPPVTVPAVATVASPTVVAPPPLQRRRVWPRMAAVLLLGGLAAAGLGAALVAMLDGDDDRRAAASDDEFPSTTTTEEPTSTTSEGDLETYCDLVVDYYDRVDEFEAGVDIFAGEEEYDAAFAEFARDNADLWPRLRDSAPPEIAGDVDTVAGAFEQAAGGDVGAFDTDEVNAAEDTTTEFEADECGISPPVF